MVSFHPFVYCFCLLSFFWSFLFVCVVFQVTQAGTDLLGNCSIHEDEPGLPHFDPEKFSGYWYESVRTRNPYEASTGSLSYLDVASFFPWQPAAAANRQRRYENDVIYHADVASRITTSQAKQSEDGYHTSNTKKLGTTISMQPAATAVDPSTALLLSTTAAEEKQKDTSYLSELTTSFHYAPPLDDPRDYVVHWFNPCLLHIPFLVKNIPLCIEDVSDAEKPRLPLYKQKTTGVADLSASKNFHNADDGRARAMAEVDMKTVGNGKTLEQVDKAEDINYKGTLEDRRIEDEKMVSKQNRKRPTKYVRMRIHAPSNFLWKHHDAVLYCKPNEYEDDSQAGVSGNCVTRFSWFPALFTHRILETDYHTSATLYSCVTIAGFLKFEYAWMLRRKPQLSRALRAKSIHSDASRLQALLPRSHLVFPFGET
ncbi:unnamed protein product [Amoebophrya sp. A25]|nr:unnamed protein product [Amoebophrya sp. A25]|eukprot:GSA25T00007745001.1